MASPQGTPIYPRASVPGGRRSAAVVGLVVALAAGGLGVAKVSQAASDTSTKCDSPSLVTVAAPEAIVDAVQHAADAVEASGSVCATYNVSAQNPGDTYKSIVESSEDEPQVWISDSSMWPTLINKKLGNGWVTVGDTIATSPVMLGVPQSLKSRVSTWGGTDGKPGNKDWLYIMGNNEPTSFIDTDQSSASLANVIAANQQATTKDDRSTLMRDVLRLSRNLSTTSTMNEKAQEDASLARMFPLSEQQLVAFNDEHPDKELTGYIPKGGVTDLKYQWVTPVRVVQADPAALQALQDQLTSPAEQTYRASQGFRGPNGEKPDDSRFPTSMPTMPTANDATVVGADTAWNNLKKDARMLVLLDVSGSMRTEVRPGESRIQLLTNTALGALDALPQTTRLGAWGFSSDLQKNHIDYLPLTDGEKPLLDAKYKQSLIKKAMTLPGLAERNGDTALYDSLAAAYKSVTDTYDPNYINSVVVMTDGKNDDPNGGLSLDQLLDKLKAQYNPDKPVKIVTVTMGDDTDPEAMQKIAKATDGLSYSTSTPDQIAEVFVDAFLRRSDF